MERYGGRCPAGRRYPARVERVCGLAGRGRASDVAARRDRSPSRYADRDRRPDAGADSVGGVVAGLRFFTGRARTEHDQARSHSGHRHDHPGAGQRVDPGRVPRVDRHDRRAVGSGSRRPELGQHERADLLPLRLGGRGKRPPGSSTPRPSGPPRSPSPLWPTAYDASGGTTSRAGTAS